MGKRALVRVGGGGQLTLAAADTTAALEAGRWLPSTCHGHMHA